MTAHLATNLIRIAEEHGFRAEPRSRGVVVFVVWYDPATGETGEDPEYAYSLADLRAILGY